MITLIDAHGPDHGLHVSVSDGIVTLRQWGELCEPDHDGNLHPHIQHVEIDLATCLEYAEKDGRAWDGQRDRVMTGALYYLSYWGGDEEHMDEGDTPCQHFFGECTVCVPWKVGDPVVISIGAIEGRSKSTFRGRVIGYRDHGPDYGMTIGLESGSEVCLRAESLDGPWETSEGETAWPQNCEGPRMRLE